MLNVAPQFRRFLLKLDKSTNLFVLNRATTIGGNDARIIPSPMFLSSFFFFRDVVVIAGEFLLHVFFENANSGITNASIGERVRSKGKV